jgi:hypothetical protein
MLPRGNTGLPNSCMVRSWHSTGSPTAAVADEKFGSSMVHCSKVPAGTRMSCARETSADTTTAAALAKIPMSRLMVFLLIVFSDQTARRDSRFHRQTCSGPFQ